MLGAMPGYCGRQQKPWKKTADAFLPSPSSPSEAADRGRHACPTPEPQLEEVALLYHLRFSAALTSSGNKANYTHIDCSLLPTMYKHSTIPLVIFGIANVG